MRLPIAILSALVAAAYATVVGASEPARPIESVKLRVAGTSIPAPATALFDGREVYISLDAVRALKCNVAVREREDSAIVSSPQGHRREIALARLRQAPMAPLSALAPLLDMRFSVQDGVCELMPRAKSAASSGGSAASSGPTSKVVVTQPAASPRPDTPKAGPPAAASPPRQPQVVAAPASAPSPAQKSPEPTKAPVVQPADSVDGRPSVSAVLPWRSGPGQAVPQPLVVPRDGQPKVAPTPPKTTPTRQLTRIRDVVCEAVDPAQTKLTIYADGPLKPTVRVLKGMTQLAVDIPSAMLDGMTSEWAFDNPLITGARATETGAPFVVRVVFDVARLVTYRSRPAPPDGFEIVVRLPRLVGRKFEEMRVVIDPGHGGPSATGCSAMLNGARVVEKDLNLKIARRVYENLQQAGLHVLMTRSSDQAVSLSERPEMANANLADIFVSIHVDDAPGNPRASGPTAYYHGSNEDGRALGFSIVEAVASAGGLPSRGARSDLSRFATGMAVLKRAEMPAVLIEIAYISNPSDRAKLVTAEFQSAVAKSIADGIRRYVEGKLPATAPKKPETP